MKKQGLVEGRYPNLFVVSEIASLTGNKAAYIKNRPFDKEYYKRLILSFIQEFKSATRKDINDLLMSKLSDTLNEKQKLNKINNILNEISNKDKKVKNLGSDRKPRWVLR